MSEPTGVHALPPWAQMHRVMNATPGERERLLHLAERVNPSAPRLSTELLREAFEAVAAAPYEPDPAHVVMTEHLNRLAATFHPGGRYPCPVAGCRWALDVPPPELVDVPPPELGPERYRSTLRYVGAPREQVELALVSHLDAHATDGAPPPMCEPVPEPWLEEDDDGEPDGWRCP